jgi:hypothetical protein
MTEDRSTYSAIPTMHRRAFIGSLSAIGVAAALPMPAGIGAGEPGPQPFALLIFPPATGKVIFQHAWGSVDVPDILQTAGKRTSTQWLAINKFRVVNPVGRFKIVTDKQTNLPVLDVLVTRENELAGYAHHHTEIEPHMPDHLINGRGYKLGQRYLWQWWRKNLDYVPDNHWEIEWQIHGWPDNSVEAGRNPPVAIDGGYDGRMTLWLRGSQEQITPKKDSGAWNYTRENRIPDIGPNGSEQWAFWEVEFLLDPKGGAIDVRRDGQLLYSEVGKPLGFNDSRGGLVYTGWYKFFSEVSTARRQAQFGPIRVQEL